jgi:outer membrane protein assembly factor BamE (lipoprotein component of BamABCDE complex)
MRKFITPLALVTVFLVSGCMSAGQHKAAVRDDSTDRVTVGNVQREIRVGMSGAEVAQVLGSPNIVTTDEKRREAWIYDKVATETAYSTSSGGVAALILGFGSGAAGAVAPSANQGAGAVSTTQRTLTVIIKFDEGGKVRDFAYHASQF